MRRRAEAAETRAAAIARSLSDELWQPTGRRGDFGEGIAALDALREELARAVLQMGQVVGPPSAKERRPQAGRIPTPRYLRELRQRLRLLDRALAGVAVCQAGQEWPLLPEPRPPLDLADTGDRLVARTLTRVAPAVNPEAQTTDAVDHGCFPDISLDSGRFVQNLHLAYRLCLARKMRGPLRFLDIGCGGGLKVVLAAQVFSQAQGLDYDSGYVAAAGRVFAAMGAGRCHAVEADGLTFAGYGGYDVLYFYDPMYEPLLLELERHVAASARDGSVIIAPGYRFELRAADLGLTRVADAVYLKGAGADDGQALIAETRRMGPHIADPDRTPPPAAGWVEELWQACLANGIDPDRLPAPRRRPGQRTAAPA